MGSQPEIGGLIRHFWPCLLLGIALSVLGPGCRTAPGHSELQRYSFQSPHMGTMFYITLYATNSGAASEAATAAFHRIATLEDIMSDYQADSELNLLCEKPPGVPASISPELCDVFRRAAHISQISSGAFDVTVGPYVRLWRFARKRKVLPTAAEIAVARTKVGWQKLRIDPEASTATLAVAGMRLDLGGIAKGYAADQAMKELRSHGVSRAFVAASGDISIGDPPPGEPGWKVGIAGWEPRGAPSTILLQNAAISTSGDTEQFVEIDGVRYSHIVSPVTGLGLTDRIQVTVVAPDATTTDSMATAVSVLGKDAGLRLVEQQPRTAALILVPIGDGEQKAFLSRRFERLKKVSEPPTARVR